MSKMRLVTSILGILALQLCTLGVADDRRPTEQPPVYFVLIHTPGPAWQKDVPFREQPGVEIHVQYMAGLLERGLMVMGGPFLDDAGGMVISKAQSIEDARHLAREDPAIQSGLLNVQVHPWLVRMQSATPEN